VRANRERRGVSEPFLTLEADPESIAVLRDTLERHAYDAAQQALRPDYFTSPFPHYENFSVAIESLASPLPTLFRLLALGQPVPAAIIEAGLGRDFAEAGLATGLL